MKGIVLAGGHGTRLHPLTLAVSKQLMPVYDKPMIYYPISVLMLAGIRDILVISTPEDLPMFRRLLGDGSRWGVGFSFVAQPKPEGLAQAFLLGEDFLAGGPSALILGDNLFFGHGLPDLMRSAAARPQGATVFGYWVKNPSDYGVLGFGEGGEVTDIAEKPARPRSNYAVVGLYFYDDTVVGRARALKPSPRGELEITDLNRSYLEDRQLAVELMGRGFAWLDTGTPGSLLQASNFIQTLQERQSLMIGSPEEVAFRMGFIDAAQLSELGSRLSKSPYGEYLLSLTGSADRTPPFGP